MNRQENGGSKKRNIATNWRDRLPPIGEAYWYARLKMMINSGDLYMVLIDLPSYAYPDKMRKENHANLAIAGIESESPDEGFSDGLFSYPNKTLDLARVYLTEELTPNPSEIETITLENASGFVEFGTTNLCKSIAYLQGGSLLLRVPYGENLNFKNPTCAIFYYKRKKP